MVIDEILVEQLLNESESNTLDFKEQQYPFVGASDDKKSELLKDVLAFANTLRRRDAFILVGVREIKGGRSIPLGISEEIDDAKLQQFINSKTQKSVNFSYCTIPFQSVQLGIIHIPIQERPIYLRNDYGKLRKTTVYIRRGTSTDEATPDEIVSMGRSADERKISGVTASLLDYMIKDANTRLHSMPEPKELVAVLGIELADCKDPIEELESLGLIESSRDMNSPIGYARVRLLPSFFIKYADQVLQGIDIVGEIKRTLNSFPNNGDPVLSEFILKSTKIPLVRLQLIIDFLLEESIIEATKGWMGEDKLSFMHGHLLHLGKRILKGDEPLPVLNQYLT